MTNKKGGGLKSALLFLILAAVCFYFGKRYFPPPQGSSLPESSNTITENASPGIAGLLQSLTDFLPTEGVGFLTGDNGQNLGELGNEYDFPPESCIYFSFLNSAQQTVYRQVYANALILRKEFSLAEKLSPLELEQAVEALRYDHPELFWLNNSYRYGYDAQGLAVSLILAFDCTEEELPAMRERFDSQTEKILSKAETLYSDLEKEKYVHDYLVDHCVYLSNADYSQSAYSALVNQESVCAGYASAFQYLMNRLGIPCYYCPGTADGGRHAWNIILLDGKAYHVDLTWDDPSLEEGDRRYYNYFNLTDQQISATHVRSEFAELLPDCDSLDASYQNAFSPDPADTSVSYYRTSASLGIPEQEVISSLEQYYSLCRDKMLESDELSQTLLFAVKEENTLQAILESANSGQYLEGYLQDVVEKRGLYGYAYSANLYSEPMNDGALLLIQTIVFSRN